LKIGRIKDGDKTSYVEVVGEEIRLIDGDVFGDETSDWRVTEEKRPLLEVELLAPVHPAQIVAIGRNYFAHAKELGSEIPKEPLIFLKGINSVTGPGQNIILPNSAPDEVDFEAELVVVIGKKAKNVSEEDAGDYIFGYTCGNDVSARDCQKRRDKQWARGKGFDTFAPLGPWIETDIDPDKLDISLRLNGEVMQKSNTANMMFSSKRLVSYISHNMTLFPGSVIMTGTPEGVGYGRDPRVFLREDDEVVVEIEEIGRLINGVIKET